MADRGTARVQPTPSASVADSYGHVAFLPHAFGDTRYVGTGLQGPSATNWVYHPQPANAWPGLATAVIFGPW